MTIFAPCAAIPRSTARPMPLPPPVTTATRPSSSPILVSSRLTLGIIWFPSVMSDARTGIEDDLLDAAVIADPHPVLGALRERDPVHWSETHRAWLVSRYDDVAFVLTDPRFSAERVGAALGAMSPERRRS